MSNELELTNPKDMPTVGEAFGNKEAFEHAQRVAKMISASNLVPQRFRGNVADTMIALEMANRLKASPIMVMQNLYVVHGAPGWSGQFIISVINSCGKFKELEFELSGSGDTLSCYAFAEDKRTGRIRKGTTITMAMAKAEGWVDKVDREGRNISKWRTMPEQMIQYRAASFFGRIHCPEILMGMYTVEEIEEYTVMSDMNMDEYIQNLVNTCTYSEDEREIIRSKVDGGLTMEEARNIINDLKNNQLDPVTQGAYYSATDAKEKAAEKTNTEDKTKKLF